MHKNITPIPTEAYGRILDAAEELFSEQGYDAVSMSAIAERASVSKANIFHHFKTKRELYLAVLKYACHESTCLLDNIVQAAGNLEGRLCHFIQAHMAYLYEHRRVTRLILRELIENDPRQGHEIAEEVLGENFTRFVGILREGQTRGELRDDVDPAIVAALLVGANVFFFQSAERLCNMPGVDLARDTARYTQMLSSILLQGVLRRPEETSKTENGAIQQDER